MRCNTLVMSPARRTHNSNEPLLRLGDDVIEIGASPTPNTDSSTNWPGSCPNDTPRGSSNLNSFSHCVIGFTSRMRAGWGRYRESLSVSWSVSGIVVPLLLRLGGVRAIVIQLVERIHRRDVHQTGLRA